MREGGRELSEEKERAVSEVEVLEEAAEGSDAAYPSERGRVRDAAAGNGNGGFEEKRGRKRERVFSCLS